MARKATKASFVKFVAVILFVCICKEEKGCCFVTGSLGDASVLEDRKTTNREMNESRT